MTINTHTKTGFLLVLLLLVSVSTLHSQSSASSHFDMTGFPQWSKDLRRGEIVALGSFPFTLFFSSFVMDTFRLSTNGFDMRYAPWPINTGGAVGWHT